MVESNKTNVQSIIPLYRIVKYDCKNIKHEGDFNMNTEIRKKIAYDLTLEYVKQNNIMKVNMDSTIPKSINTVEKIYNEIYASLEGKNIL